MLIESEGLLYRGIDAYEPKEIWDYPRKKWVRNHGGRWSKPGKRIDDARAEALKVNNPDAEHYFYDDDPPWRQPLNQAYRDSLLTPAMREQVARRQAELAELRAREPIAELPPSADVIPIDDGFGAPLGFRYPMLAKPGSHTAYARTSDLVVEWYDFGDRAPYESANLLTFDRAAQRLLAEAIGVDPALSPHQLACKVALRFDSYFQVKTFAGEQGIPFETEVDFAP